MIDELLIRNFLEKNYIVTTDSDYFRVTDIVDKTKHSSIDEFLEVLTTIFGEFTLPNGDNSVKLFYKWFDEKKMTISKDLIEFVDSLDISKGSIFLLEQTIIHFKYSKNNRYGFYDLIYTPNFIGNYINEYYKNKVLNDKIKNLIESNDFGNVGSKFIIKKFSESINNETPKLVEYALSKVNKWYSETIIGAKMRDFLSQLVITLGPRNWVVTWIGHGQLTNDTLLNNFKDEDEFHHKFIKKMYDSWYEEAVINASERVLMRNNFSN